MKQSQIINIIANKLYNNNNANKLLEKELNTIVIAYKQFLLKIIIYNY